MRHSGTGTPALIFRHFAVVPGFLDWTWRAVGEEVRSGEVLRHSLDAVARTPRVVLPDLPADALAAVDRAVLRAIFANYRRMNPMNYSLIAAIRALLAIPDARTEEVAPLPAATAQMPEPCPALPPPVKVRDLPADLQQTLVALSASIPDSGAQVVPTLYRHLALWPELLRQLAPGILAAIQRGEVATLMRELAREMRPLVGTVIARARGRGLPRAPLQNPASMVRTLDSFLFAIPQMIVVGAAIEAAASPALGGDAFDSPRQGSV
jgi:hypothetical protein